MNAQSKDWAISASAEPALSPLRTEPASRLGGSAVSITYRDEWRETRDRLTAEQLKTITLRTAALQAAWAMQGLCKRAEKAGVDVTYWRDLAATIEGRIE